MDMKPLIDVLNENNGLIRDWGEIKHNLPELNGKFAIIVENIKEAQKLLDIYSTDIDFILSFDSYQKCDFCHYIFSEEEITIVDGDCLCSSCNE